jgi:hypothetical protein
LLLGEEGSWQHGKRVSAKREEAKTISRRPVFLGQIIPVRAFRVSCSFNELYRLFVLLVHGGASFAADAFGEVFGAVRVDQKLFLVEVHDRDIASFAAP